jgi:DNA/RNA-binding domain of Phe-tRNA-synthetase-like protein
MEFSHAAPIWAGFPELAAGVVFVAGIGADDDAGVVPERTRAFYATAERRLANATEAELPEIRAWRSAFARMGLKPTQYRCAAESLLRRFRREHILPSIHPLVDLCNAVSLSYAIPVAVLDMARVTGTLQVRYATGTERYLAFSGQTEHPSPGEVIFADSAGNAHARRWTHRQSALSAVSGATSRALIVAEAMHESAAADVASLIAAAAAEITEVWPSATTSTALLSADRPHAPASRMAVVAKKGTSERS